MSFVMLAPPNGPETPSLTVETLCFGFWVLYTPPRQDPAPCCPGLDDMLEAAWESVQRLSMQPYLGLR